MDLFLTIIQTLAVLALVVLLAHLSLRLMKSYMTRQSKIIRIIERVAISSNSSLAIVEICNQYYLMSFTGQENQILKVLDQEELKGLIGEVGEQSLEMNDKFFTRFKGLVKKQKRNNDYWNEGRN